MAQHVLFYSKFCEHSNEIVQLIRSYNLQNLVQMACVDSIPRNMIPPNLTSVPTIMTPEKTMMCDIECFNYVARLGKTQSPTEIAPYNEAVGIASQFESLDNSQAHGNFYFIEGNSKPDISPPSVHDGKKSISDSHLEKMMEERNNDMKAIFGDKPPLRR